ncbi:MAG: Dipeptidyl aminopeptidase BIII [Gammaproteobacteria bacterium]|nr:Dipeptidyl aminopeptidase BIII [Gammaproteobacteria bacterium]
MTRDLKTAPHGLWTGLFDAKALFEKPATPMYPVRRKDRTIWLETRTEEGGRGVLMERDSSGAECCLTPEGFSVRSRVHEYGGCPYTLHDDTCYFVNDGDQRIYRQYLDVPPDPQPVTPRSKTDDALRYIDLCVVAGGAHLVCVMERERSSSDIENCLAVVRIEPGAIHDPRVLHRGHDFYANLVLDSAHRRIAWFQWDDPNMPWDRSEAMIASFSQTREGLRLGAPASVINASETSVCQLAFDDDGDLLLAIDGNSAPGMNQDFWNLYRWRGGEFIQLTFDDKEYGAPHWVFGDCRYVVLQDYLLAVRTGADGDELVTVDKHGGGVEVVRTDAVNIKQLSRAGGNEALMIAATRDRSPTLTMWRHERLTPIKSVRELLPGDGVSRPEAVEYPTGNAEVAHAYFYPPCNPHYTAPEGDAPPMLVMVHGGPTARSSNALDLTRQYWTGFGFAVLDVNYRGSTGYGRAYRQSLLGRWGQGDTEDIAKGIKYIADLGWINRDCVFIRGRSAGGYAVLSALTQYPEAFAAGACYYGIGDLLTLVRITHKFEGRYTDRLIGEDYRSERAKDATSRFYTRSPIHFVSAISCPVIVFQGREDKVVPPDISREIVRALKRHGRDYDYIEYPGEGHGFRTSDANIDALAWEAGFFRDILSANARAEAH